MPTSVEFVIALGLIVVAASLFTNAVEILGVRLEMGQGAVGSVLAAVGTALPETMIPIVAVLAVVFAGGDAETAGEIGIGAILGAPFTLWLSSPASSYSRCSGAPGCCTPGT